MIRHQNLPEVRRQDLFRRAGRALHRVRAENRVANASRRIVAAGDQRSPENIEGLARTQRLTKRARAAELRGVGR
jgi:hypothetical protein